MECFKIQQNKQVVNVIYFIFILLSMTIFFPFVILAENIESIIEVINHSDSYAAIDDAKDSMPHYLRKVDFQLLDVVRQLRLRGITRSNATMNNVDKQFSTPVVTLNNKANFHVNIHLKQLNEKIISKLKALGVTVQGTGKKFRQVTCWVPFDLIETLAKDDNVGSIYNVSKPYVKTLPYTTVGDQILNADDARSTFGIDGEDIKVGVISDDADNYLDAINAGYLDASLFYNDWNNPFESGNEGTAMSEIVHVLAPQAEIHFEAAGFSWFDLKQSIVDIHGRQGCKVIVDDVGFADEPMFEYGDVAVLVDDLTSMGVIYISSAGNGARRTWNGMSADGNSNEWMEFSGSYETNTITVPPYRTIKVALQWANKWEHANDDFDIYLFAGPDPSSKRLASSVNYQGGNGYIPYEFFTWTNLNSTPQTVYLRIKLKNVSASREMMMFVWNVPGSLSHFQGRSIWGHTAAYSCISVGAINAFDGQSIEDFSSIGPVRFYGYDENGYPTDYIDFPAPTICGIDDVQTYIGSASPFWPDGYPTFLGTSAAAPHIAAIVALILDQDGNLDWEQVKSILTLSADKVPGMGGQNFTNDYGFGRSNAYTSCRNLYVPHVYPTIPSALSAAKSGQIVVVTPGNYTISTSLTVPSGKTLSIESGVTLRFGFGVSLISNGKLLAENATFTSTGSTSPGAWGSLQLNGSGASYSTLTNCNIQYGTQINILNGANYVRISGCNITNSSGHGINVSSSSSFQAISNNIANGNTNNGITITGGSQNRCSGNTIYKYQGSSGYHHGAGIKYNSSSGVVTRNDISYYSWGVGAIYGSSLNSSWSYGSDHNNRITNGIYGLKVYQNSWCTFGKVVAGMDDGNGNNSIYGNTYHVEVGNNINDPNTLYASYNWWGSNPPQTSKFLVWPFSSTFIYNPWLTSDPWGQYPLKSRPEQGDVVIGENNKYSEPMSQTGSSSSTNKYLSATDDLQDSLLIGRKFNGKNTNKESIEYLRSYLNNHPNDYASYVVMYGLADSATTPKIIDLFKLYNSKAPKIHKLLLANLYQMEGKIDLAQKENDNIIAENPNTSLAVMAQIKNMLIELYSKNNIDAAKVILNNIKTKSSLIDPMDLADAELAFTTYVDPKTGNMPNAGNPHKNADGQISETIVNEGGLIANYPNPFNPSTMISYKLKSSGHVTLKIYDILGREIVSLVNENQDSGMHSVKFDGTPYASGIYFYKLTAPGINQIKKMLLTK